MLIKHPNYVTSKTRSVKFMAALALASAALTVAPITAQASPNLGSIQTTEYSAKFKLAMFQDQAGIQQVYTSLREKAEKACKIGTAVNSKGEIMSKSECADDLLSQFIESADVSVLTAYHMDQEKMGG